MKGKNVMFVGDSLGRNQWESLICMISAAVPQSPTQMNRGDPLSTFKFLVSVNNGFCIFFLSSSFLLFLGLKKKKKMQEYGVTVSFYRAPYLVDIDTIQGRRVLKLDDIRGNANAWRGVDLLSFNTGHWWTHKGSLQG